MHDLTAVRIHVLPALYAVAAAGLRALADLGYEGAGHGILTPVKAPAGSRPVSAGNRARNALLRGLRCLGERGFSLLTRRWRALQHITASPGKIAPSSKPPSSSRISNTAICPESR